MRSAPFTLSILSPVAFDLPCRSEYELTLYSLGWLIGRERWGYC